MSYPRLVCPHCYKIVADNWWVRHMRDHHYPNHMVTSRHLKCIIFRNAVRQAMTDRDDIIWYQRKYARLGTEVGEKWIGKSTQTVG